VNVQVNRKEFITNNSSRCCETTVCLTRIMAIRYTRHRYFCAVLYIWTQSIIDQSAADAALVVIRMGTCIVNRDGVIDRTDDASEIACRLWVMRGGVVVSRLTLDCSTPSEWRDKRRRCRWLFSELQSYRICEPLFNWQNGRPQSITCHRCDWEER